MATCRHGSVDRYCPHCDGWPEDAPEETPCPKRDDGQHCNCWYDGETCCACGDPAASGVPAEARD